MKFSEIEKKVVKSIFNNAKNGESNEIVLEVISGIEQKILSDVKRTKKEKEKTTAGKGQPAKSAS